MEERGGYRAAVESAALFDRSDRGKIVVAGNDRRAYLHAMLTNDILSLPPGGGCYAAYLTPQGRMIADMVVLDLGDVLLLDLDRSVTPAVLSKLDQFVFNEDVKFGDVSDAFGRITLAGPAAAGLVAGAMERSGGLPVTADELGGWATFRSERASFRGELLIVAASDEVGVAGFDLYVERPQVERLSAALIGAGAVPAGAADWESLRIESGRPAFGLDMDADTIPLEAGIEPRAISFTKGCYPGQEVVIRVLHRGHGRIARKIVGLAIDGTGVPGAGDALRAGDREAGRVTSAAWSPRMGGPVALAMVQREFFEPGTGLTVVHGDRTLAARVVALPFRQG